MSSPTILPDSEALLQIKEGSRKIYIKAFDGLREYIDNDLETRPPCENEMLHKMFYGGLRLSEVMNLEMGEWNPTQDELQKMNNTAAINKNPIKIESGGKVFIINKIEHFHY